MSGPVAYLIPEFPGQTHIWMWRELSHLRAWGVGVELLSTREPPARDRARHAWADAAQRETTYVGEASVPRVVLALLLMLVTRPMALLGAVRLAMSLPVTKGRPWMLVPWACWMARHLRRRGVTHVHVHSCANTAVLAMLVHRLIGVPYSLTLNANIEWWGGAMGEKFARSRFTLAITQWLLDQIHRDFPALPPGRAMLGRIGVDTRKWRAREAEPCNDPPRIVCVGRLHPSKGHDVLLQAMRELPGVGLTIVGDGPSRSELEQRVDALGLRDRVSFTGSVSEDEVIRHMAQADLFVLASHAEPLGVVYMEAMALGVATIGTAAGGVGEIITSGVDGLLVPPMDAPALAQAIRGLLADPVRRRELALAGRRTIEQRFDSRLGAATVYEQVFGKPPPPPMASHP